MEALRVEYGFSVASFCRVLALPARTYYERRARDRASHHVRGPWPTPARDGIRAIVIGVAVKHPMWGHRKVAWLCRHEQGLLVAEATCLRILREAELVLPIDCVRGRRDLAGARRQALLDPPTRRNQVWQMDYLSLRRPDRVAALASGIELVVIGGGLAEKLGQDLVDRARAELRSG